MFKAIRLRIVIMLLLVFLAFFSIQMNLNLFGIFKQASAVNMILQIENALQVKIFSHSQNLWLSLIYRPWFLFGGLFFVVHILNLGT